MSAPKPHFAILDVLRALAAVVVCLFHFNYRNGGNLSAMLEYGHYGVEVFFVISGFVIPLAMSWSKFQYRDTPNFLVRRFIRLYPVFAIVALSNVVLSTYGSPLLGFGGDSPDLTWTRALANFTLTCDLVGETWYLPVFWTLAIEAQYYFVIALSYPLLVHRKTWVQVMALMLWIVPSYFVGYGETVFSWTAFFSIGILAFLKQQKRISDWVFWPLLLMAAYSHQETRNLTSANLGVLTAVCILYCPPSNAKWLVKLGAISYSLYLLHLAFGGAVLIHLRLLPESLQWINTQPVGITLATLVSIGAAMLFYRWIELPIHNLARKFKTRAREKELAE
ncbi:acyltransferase [Oceaniferula spumae]|uniref:Acyltransferase n=1 Tax=Oceaniferula spumae TaxID=2979115 RepID=A0AAT9FQ49_9BACT